MKLVSSEQTLSNADTFPGQERNARSVSDGIEIDPDKVAILLIETVACTAATHGSASSSGIIAFNKYLSVNSSDLRLCALALHNWWPRRELFHRLGRHTPIFIHDSLVLPWVLATLRHHFRLTIKASQTPTIIKMKKDATVNGMIVAGLDSQKTLEDVEVTTVV